MLVKCSICGNKIDRDTAFKRIVKEKNVYCCSEDEYIKEEQRKEKDKMDKDSAYRLICDIIGTKEIINTVLWKEWAIWNKVADNYKLSCFLEEKKDYLIRIMSNVTGEFNRIRYLSAVIKNSLGDYQVKETVVQHKIVQEQTFYDSTASTTNKRRSLADLEDEI